MDSNLLNRPGTYVLLLHAAASESIAIGRLGILEVKQGYYLYVGSAHGPGGVQSRVGRHLRSSKRCHWHVDYLREQTEPVAVWVTYDQGEWEHEWAGCLLSWPGSVSPLARFGASDCSCRSHLLYFSARPTLPMFQEYLVKHVESVPVILEVSFTPSFGSDEE